MYKNEVKIMEETVPDEVKDLYGFDTNAIDDYYALYGVK